MASLRSTPRIPFRSEKPPGRSPQHLVFAKTAAMLSSGKVVRGIQGRLQHAGNAAVIARRAGQRRTAAKRSAALLFPGLGRGSTMGTSSTIRTAGYSTTAPAERGEPIRPGDSELQLLSTQGQGDAWKYEGTYVSYVVAHKPKRN